MCAGDARSPVLRVMEQFRLYFFLLLCVISLVSRARLDAHAPAALFAAHSSCSSQVGRGEYEPMKLLK
jgi:hypothetical protein